MVIFRLVLEVESGFYKNKYQTKVLFMAENKDEGMKRAKEWWKKHEKMPQNHLFPFGGFGDKPLKFAGIVELKPYALCPWNLWI